MYCRAVDKLRSYEAAKRKVAPGLDHWSHKRFNDRAENSHLQFRKRERAMQGFRSLGGLQRFAFMQFATRNHLLSHINVGTGVDASIMELAQMVARVTGLNGRITNDPSSPMAPCAS
jgi:hypothetical protein